MRCIIFLFVFSFARAEYRVFELEITAYEQPDPAAPSADPAKLPVELGKRVVTSTLDPQQYRGYFTVQPNEQIRYIATWKCKGRTGNKDYCPNPKVKTESEVAAVPSENK